jgi:hypothetical protein
MLFIRMVVLPFFVAFAFALAVLFLMAFSGQPIYRFELAAFMIPTALMTSGYFGVKAVLQELARAHAAINPEAVGQEAGVPDAP